MFRLRATREASRTEEVQSRTAEAYSVTAVGFAAYNLVKSLSTMTGSTLDGIRHDVEHYARSPAPTMFARFETVQLEIWREA